MINDNTNGEISEWNEGNFKSLRLHQAQEIINVCSLYPFKKMYGEWSYKLWFKSIVVLFKEGMQKYSDSEYKQTIVLKDTTEKILNEFNGLKQSGNKITVNLKGWEDLKQKLEEFEYKVKKLNDQHGLSTRNQKYEGMF